MRCLMLAVFLIAMGTLTARAAAPAPAASAPETVHVTYRVRQGQEAAFEKVLAKHWPTCRRLRLVLDHPHLVLRGSDEPGKTTFVEILRWRDHETPDSVPPEVEAIWSDMRGLTEKRGGHPAIDIEEVEIVGSEGPR